jgi:hypothetical protein
MLQGTVMQPLGKTLALALLQSQQFLQQLRSLPRQLSDHLHL